MQLPQELSRAIYLLLLLFLVSSCASVKIVPPGSEVQTILILPYSKLDTTGWSAGYIYHYNIVNLGDDSITYEAKFNQSGKEGYLVVNSLPPGNYRVDKVIVNPVGTGIRDFDRSEYRRNEKFKLVAGKITIFQKSIHAYQIKDSTDPGRSFSGFRIDPVFPDRRNNILEKLGKQENFDKWEVLGFQQSVVGSSADSEETYFNNYNDGEAGYCVIPILEKMSVTPRLSQGDCPNLNFIDEKTYPLQFYRLLNVLSGSNRPKCYPNCYDTTITLEKELVLKNIKGSSLYDNLTGEITSQPLEQIRQLKDTIELTFCTGDKNSIVLLKNMSCNLVLYPTKISYAEFIETELRRDKTSINNKICYQPEKKYISWNTDSCNRIPGAVQLIFDSLNSNSKHSVFHYDPMETGSS